MTERVGEASTPVVSGTISIGEVLQLLKREFPDVTISKIRFLESEGLVTPERTASGYRRFAQRDIDQLRARECRRRPLLRCVRRPVVG